MIVKTKYNIGEVVIVRKNNKDYNCEITDITIYIHPNLKENYITYSCLNTNNLKNIVATEKDMTRCIKLYKVRKWLSMIFYNLYLKFDKI